MSLTIIFNKYIECFCFIFQNLIDYELMIFTKSAVQRKAKMVLGWGRTTYVMYGLPTTNIACAYAEITTPLFIMLHQTHGFYGLHNAWQKACWQNFDEIIRNSAHSLVTLKKLTRVKVSWRNSSSGQKMWPQNLEELRFHRSFLRGVFSRRLPNWKPENILYNVVSNSINC